MSSASIVTAAKSILRTGMGSSLATIEDLDAVPFAISPFPSALATAATSPCALLQFMRAPEKAAAHGYGRVDGELDVHIWSAIAAPTPADAQEFKELVDSALLVLRAHPRLGGLADVVGVSKILLAGWRMSVQFTRPIIRPSRVWQHAVITNPITEFVQMPLAVA